MNSLWVTNRGLRLSLVLLLPLALWLLVWLGVQNGIQQISFSDHPAVFLFRARGALPLFAAFFGMVMIVVKISKHQSGGLTFFGPLGFVTVYGLVGLVASLLSPNGSVALYWAAIYLSVPLVLWGIVWGRDGLGSIQRLINLNWLIILLIVVAMFVAALLYLDLGSLILTPSSWFDCSLYRNWHGNTWLDFTSGFLRPTGVGRYAALAAILAVGGLWSGRSRWLWAAILAAALILLLTSGARGAFLGFAVSVLLVTFLYASKYGIKKIVVWGGLCIAVLIPVVWLTGIHRQFIDSCIIRDAISGSPQQSLSLQEWDLPIRVTIPPGGWILEQVSRDDQDVSSASAGTPLLTGKQTLSDVFARVLVPRGLLIEIISLTPEEVTPDTPARVGIPTGEWRLKPFEQNQADTKQPLQLLVPKGPLVLDQLAPGETLDPKLIILGTGKPSLLTLSGRSSIWSDGFRLFKEQPILGQGFHADRLLLGTHMHNTLMHALVQTGLLGTIPLIVALLFGWVLLIKALRHRASLPEVHRHLIIQVAGVIVFFSFRAVPESTGAFYGVDWLLLAPLLVYLQVVTRAASVAEEPDESRARVHVVPWKPITSWLRKSPST